MAHEGLAGAFCVGFPFRFISGIVLRAGWPEPADEPFVNDLVVTGDVSGDAVFGAAKDIGVFAIFIDDPFGTCS